MENNNDSLPLLVVKEAITQNRRLFKLSIIILVGWLVSVIGFVSYIAYDRWQDSQKEKTVTIYQHQDIDQDNIENITQDLNTNTNKDK